MDIWKKGAIIGGIWGLLSIIPYSYISSFDPLDKKILFTLLGLPTFMALTLKFHFLFVFIGGPIVGIIIGAGIGYLIERIRMTLTNSKLKTSQIFMLVIIGFIWFSNMAIADTENGTLNINLSNNTPLLYNTQSVQVTIIKVEDNEKIIWNNNEDLPFSLSLSVIPGTYRVYVKKDNSTIIEYNNDSKGYLVVSRSNIYVPAIKGSIEYSNTILTDVLSDAPWRINAGENIPITYIIKDTNQWSLYIRTITTYDDDDPIGNEAGDTLVYTRNIWQWFTGDLWYGYDVLSPSIFNENDNDLEIHVKFDIAWDFDVHNFYTVYKSPYNLPSLKNWYYGDTHYHSFYTDNVLEFGAPVELTKIVGKSIGFNWVTITDHSFDLDANRWNNLVSDSNIWSDTKFKILPSEEISCTVPGGIYQKYNHYLAYGITQFIPGGEWEDGTGSHYSCSELVSIVNGQGGFGYPAHPMDSDPFRDPWRDYSLNFKGLEIWNGEGNIIKLEEGLNKWKELLLSGRKIFIEAGSDAHGDFNSGFGKVRTMVFIPNLGNSEILSALKYGHSIMTNGPVVVFNINNTIIGDTLKVPKGSKINLNIQWNSTPEFGTVNNIKVIKGIINSNEIIERDIYPVSYPGTNQITITATENSYFRLSGFTSDGHRAYTNPIWINVTNPIITIISPNGGEKWIRGTNKEVKWSSSGSPGTNVKIELYKAGVLNKLIISSTPNDGSYFWYVPTTQTIAADYKIKVTSITNSAYTDQSNNNFVISAGSITVVSPNGGESWNKGSTRTITWSKTGSTGSYVKIELLKGGVLNRVISSSTVNDGSYSWTISSTQNYGTDYKVRITSTSNSIYNDASNNYFKIY